jgi:host factor-I protein
MVRLPPEERRFFWHCTPIAHHFSASQVPRPERFVYNAIMSFRGPQGNPNAAKRSRTPPPEDTFEEAAFLKGLGEKQNAVSVKLMDGQVFHGWIEYYDRNMVRLTREGVPNLFIFKHEIMYIAEDGGKRK